MARFRTFPQGPASFTFAVGADSRTGSNGMVYDAVRRTRPLLYLNVGDFFYGDVDRDDPDLYRRQYDSNLTAPAQAVLYASAPVAYTWGDHDFAGNDADGTAPGKPAAMEVYRQYVPHYPLQAGATSPIFQAFTVGDVRFVLTDNRSQRSPAARAADHARGAAAGVARGRARRRGPLRPPRGPTPTPGWAGRTRPTTPGPASPTSAGWSPT